MNETSLFHNNPYASSSGTRRPSLDVNMVFQISDMFNRAVNRGRLRQFWALLTRRSSRLVSLDSLHLHIRGSHTTTRQEVPIAKIKGSEGRTSDFDNQFYPLSERLRTRWQSVASARHQGIPLPLVDLVQVGSCYFVRDGHHRISVARILGEEMIEASVTVMDVEQHQAVTETAGLQPVKKAGTNGSLCFGG